MENKQLNILTDKFWKGESSTEEERQLETFLNEEAVPSGFESLANYLNFAGSTRSMELDDQFDKTILKKIEKPSAGSKTRFMIMRVAAAIILLFVAAIVLRQPNQPATVAHQSEFIDTYQDSEEAYREVKKALMMMSTNMNNGMKHAEMLGVFHQANETLKGRNKK